MQVQAKSIDGKAVSKEVKERIAADVADFMQTHAGVRRPGLAVVLVGENPASATYVKSKIAACQAAGIESFHHKLPAETSQVELEKLVHELNSDERVDGILVQLPLPDHVNTRDVLSLIDADKDVDGLTSVNQGRLNLGEDGLFPCTPLGVMELLASQNVEIKGKQAVVLGRSALVGKPVAMLLLAKDATVTLCHSRTKDLDKVCANADILVAAVGRANMVKGSWVKPGAVVIDVGINRVEDENGKGRLTGDVDFAEAAQRASAITPVPGGVGPMTVAMLLSNTVKSYKKRMQGGK